MSQHTRTPTSTTSYHNHQYRSFHYPSSNASAHSREPVSPILPSDRFPTPRSHNDAYDLRSASPFVSPIMSRTPSVAGSDRYSTVSGVTGYWPQNPDNVSPAAAYVAPFGAVQVVNEHRASARGRRSSDASDDEDDHDAPSKEDAQFSPEALKLINHFLDQLLYSILSTARSTNLHALRPAVTEVLRHRLAKEAVANADEELQELLAGGDEEEERNALAQTSSRDSRKWDLELVWKRTRLRVMVYMRLGEMEDDDEERFVKEQELFYGREADSRRFSSSSGLVSWSAAIFLTSVLEYVAEQSLQAAGGVAFARARRPSVARPEAATSKQLRVEDYDVERLALDARLGRLWRTWRKSMRNDRQRPATSGHRPVASRSSFTRDRALSLSALRRGSMGQPREDPIAAEEQYRSVRQPYIHSMAGPGYDDPESDYPEHVLASNIPLPMRDAKRDIDEIEVPGLAKNSEDDTEEDSRVTRARRNSYGSPTTGKFAQQSQAEPKSAYFTSADSRPSVVRRRSKSVPNQVRTPKLEMPGAFPVMPEEHPTSIVQEAVPESKASAVAMDDANHDREGSKVLLKDVGIMPRKVVNGEVASPQRKNTSDNTKSASKVVDQDENAQYKAMDEHAPSEDHSVGLLSGVAASATAVAGAALAAAGYSHHDDKNEENSRKEDLDQTREQPAEGSDPVLPQPRDRTVEEIAELDNRKSLADVKSSMAAESATRSQEPVLSSAAPDSDSVAQHALLNRTSYIQNGKSSTLDRKEATDRNENLIATAGSAETEEVSTTLPKTAREHGHSRHDTTTMAALEAPASPSELAEAENIKAEQKARDMPMIGSPRMAEKPGRLIITGDQAYRRDKTIPAPIETEQVVQSSASSRSPREFIPIDNLSPDSEAQPLSKDYNVQSPSEQTRVVVPRAATTSSSPATPTAAENNARDLKMVQASKEQMKTNSPQSRKFTNALEKQNSKGEVRNHPAIQSKTTPKRETIGASSTVSGTSTPPVVTTASIRGPQDFDSFLQGGDTVKYTLTPENVRDGPTGETRSTAKETSHAASLAKLSHQATEGDNTSLRNGSSSAVNDQRQSRSVRQSIKDVPAVASQQDGGVVRERRRSISKPSPRNTSSHRRSGLTAREPQVMTASTRDFADFIRSTGPDREQEVKRIHTNRSTTSLQSLRNAARSQSVGASSINSQRERTKSLTNATMAAENIPPVPRMPANGSRGPPLQAREATGAASGNTDLINFIRDGPEEQGSHRISRSVAPFRNTMDSDQFDMVGDFASSAPSNPSTGVNGTGAPYSRSTSTVPSQPTPVHRQTPSANGNAPSQRLPAAAEPEDDGRKRYRNKDPYALPSDTEDEDDDDDDELLTALPRNTNHRPKEESLVDFLRNNEPPADNAPRPISGPTATANIHKARASASEHMTPEPAQAPRSRTTQSQSNGPQPVPQTFSPPNINSTPRNTGGPKLEARGAGAPRQRIPRGNAGARLGAFEQSNTGDLADFLRSSGPAEEEKRAAPVTPRWEEPVEEQKKEKKKSFFSRFSSKK